MTSTDRHLVVDGSNIATEGRTFPSLAQLEDAVVAILDDQNFSSVTVIVDATFAHRVDQAERDRFEKAVLAGEVVVPPAGAVGRGDAFILQVAEKANAVVFSNDSFQEFHGQHDWLFDDNRLVGGKPIDGIGWVFVDRTPVKGAVSRAARQKATQDRKVAKQQTTPAPRKPPTPPPTNRTRVSKKATAVSGSPQTRSTTKVSASKSSGSDGAADNATTSDSASNEINDTTSFLQFVSKYSIGDEVEGEVARYSSHGCYLTVLEALCYLPCQAMGDPPPTKARDLVARGDVVRVLVDSLDSERRGINTTLVKVIGPRSQNETPNAQQTEGDADGGDRKGNPTRSEPIVATTKSTAKSGRNRSNESARTSKKSAASPPSARASRATTKRASASSRAKKAPAKASVKSAPAKRSTTTTKAAASKTTAAATTSTAKKAPAARKAATAKKAVAKKAPAKKAPAKKAPVKKATAAKKAPAKKAATAKKAVAKKAPAKKAPAKATTTAKKAPAKKATTAKKAVAKKAPAKATTRKTTAKRTTRARAATQK